MAEINWGAVLIVIVAIVCYLYLAHAVWLSAHEWVVASQLAHAGTITDGQIISRRLRAGGKSARCCVMYSYTTADDETPLTHEQQVSERHYRKLVEGTPVKVSYLPFKPHISRLATPDTDNTVRDSSTIVAVIACLVFLPFVVLWVLTYLIEPTIIQKHFD